MSGFSYQEYAAALKAATSSAQRGRVIEQAAEDKKISVREMKALIALAERLEARR